MATKMKWTLFILRCILEALRIKDKGLTRLLKRIGRDWEISHTIPILRVWALTQALANAIKCKSSLEIVDYIPSF